MTKTWILLGCLSAVAFADPRAKLAKNGTYADRAAAWKKFTIKDLSLGVPLEKVAGFTCGPPPGTDGFTTQNHSCVKFLDARCKGKGTKIKMIRSSGDLPPGQNCFMDEFAGSTYVDRKFMSPPVESIRLIGTDTTSPLVFRITYTFAADDLTRDSNLGKALIAKYGAPSYENAPMQMSWELGEVRLSADCRSTQGPTGEYCSLTVEDSALDNTERDLQREADEAAKRKNAPAAPAL